MIEQLKYYEKTLNKFMKIFTSLTKYFGILNTSKKNKFKESKNDAANGAMR
jgi:hypothetical protein